MTTVGKLSGSPILFKNMGGILIPFSSLFLIRRSCRNIPLENKKTLQILHSVHPKNVCDVIHVCTIFFSIECQYENTAHLEVACLPGVLIPNQAMQVDIVFYPREARRYHEVIPFEINGLSTMNVEIFGEGTDMKVICFTRYSAQHCLFVSVKNIACYLK